MDVFIEEDAVSNLIFFFGEQLLYLFNFCEVYAYIEYLNLS